MNKKRITVKQCEELESIIEQLDTLYDQGKDCVVESSLLTSLKIDNPISDFQYDQLKALLQENNPDSHIFDEVTASKNIINTTKIKHSPLLTSLNKASNEDVNVQLNQLNKWMKDCGHIPTKYPSDYYYQQWKLDGVSVQIYYEKGKLIGAGLRPRDGEFGEDVTENIKYVYGVPEQLKLPITCAIRAELIILGSYFEKVQEWKKKNKEKPFSNQRSAVVGGIRQFNDPVKTKYHYIMAIAHNIFQDNPPYITEIEKADWCNNNLGIKFVSTELFNIDDLSKMERVAPSLDYRVDGVVIGVNNIDKQNSLGQHGDKPDGNPRGKIAWKFAEEQKSVVIKDIEWSVGRTGAIKPVAIFDSVRLADTNVNRCTLHNLGYMLRNEIGVNTEVVIQKAGNIIPKVIGVKSNKCTPTYPTKCPSCNEKTEAIENGDMTELYCNNLKCPSKMVNTYFHWFKKLGCLGVGEVSIGLLVNNNKVKDRADFYNLTIKDCIDIGMTNRESLLFISAIYMLPKPTSKTDVQLSKEIVLLINKPIEVDEWKFLSALGIPALGTDVAKLLMSYLTINELRLMKPEDLLKIDGIGEITANNIYNYFRDFKDEIDELLSRFTFKQNTVGKLSGKTFCLSGTFPNGKNYWKSKIEALGGKCSNSVSKKLDYLVVEEGSGEKYKLGLKLGLNIINVKELERML